MTDIATPSAPVTSERLTGGYLTMRTRAVKAATNPHSASLARPLDGVSHRALNHIQKTRWAINKPVLDVALQCKELTRPMDGFPSAEDLPLPPMLPQWQYDALSAEDQKKHLRGIEQIRNQNAATAGLRAQVYRRLELAKDLAQFPTIWFPHFADFRGRVYPIPQDLHTQGDSLTKGLLTFSETTKLGQNGQWWMYVALANAFGHDKIALDDRAAWTDDNLVHILGTARDPMAFLDFWANDGVDSCWEALALCFEVARLCDWRVSNGLGSEVEFEGNIPIRLDATCSGIQHLSAMMRDELSARAVNVMPTGKREDIYGDVAKVANEHIALAAANGNPMALKWMGNVKRSTVKRAVMTTPYGVTERGIVEQLVNDGFCDHLERSERWEGADFMKDMIVGALDANIGAPREAMQYFMSVAKHLAEQDKPLVWTTPAGFTVRQAYYQTDMYVVNTLQGKVSLRRELPEAGLVRKKQAAAAAPNVVHSYDAAHLCITADTMRERGIRDLAFVHDSFGAHAGNVDTLSEVTRDEFVGMYQRPALEEWRSSVIEHSGVQDIPALPALGNLDVMNVRNSPFFFS